MPIYEFVCMKCKQNVEMLCSMHVDDNTLECPNCNSVGLSRKLSVFAVGSSKQDAACPIAPPGGGCAGSCACPHSH